MASKLIIKCRLIFSSWPRKALCCCICALGVLASSAAGAAGAFSGLINLNTATQAELEQLPGVGPSKASRVVEHRRLRPFRTVAELVRVKGFGVKTLQHLRPYLTVTAPTQLAAAAEAGACVCPDTTKNAPPSGANAGGVQNDVVADTKQVKAHEQTKPARAHKR